MHRILISFLLFSGILTGLTSQVIHVPSQVSTIQEGISAAVDGDTVLIAEGTYFEQINFMGKAITVASQYIVDGDTSHISKTILDGSRSQSTDSASVVTLWSGEDTCSVLCGLTITGGKGTIIGNVHLNPSWRDFNYRAGGGILMIQSGGKIIHNIIENNHLASGEKTIGVNGCGLFATVDSAFPVIIRNNVIR